MKLPRQPKQLGATPVDRAVESHRDPGKVSYDPGPDVASTRRGIAL